MAKNPKNYLSNFFLKSKIFWLVLKKVLVAFHYKFVKLLQDFGLYFKIIRNLFLEREYIIHF
jgi:hypothetical protein